MEGEAPQPKAWRTFYMVRVTWYIELVDYKVMCFNLIKNISLINKGSQLKAPN